MDSLEHSEPVDPCSSPCSSTPLGPSCRLLFTEQKKKLPVKLRALDGLELTSSLSLYQFFEVVSSGCHWRCNTTTEDLSCRWR